MSSDIWRLMAATHRSELAKCTPSNIIGRFNEMKEKKEKPFLIKRRDFNYNEESATIELLYKHEVNTLFYYLNKEDGHLYLEESDDAKTIYKLINKYAFCFEQNELEYKQLMNFKKKIKKYMTD